MTTAGDRPRWRTVWPWVVLGLLTVLPRMRLALATPGVVEADESIVFLMASHVAEGSRWAVFHYGNAYLGSADAILAGLLMRLTGVSVLAGRAFSIVLAVVFTVLTVRLGRAVGGAAVGWLAGLYVALAPSLLVLWGTRLHLGYMDILILGNLLLVLSLGRVQRVSGDADGSGRASWPAMLLTGFLIGFGIWCHLLFVVYVLSAALVLVAASRSPGGRWRVLLSPRMLAALGLGALIGASPLLLFNLVGGGGTADMFPHITGAGQDLAQRLGSGGYNLLTLGPVVLGAAVPWDLFRIEMGVTIPVPVYTVVQSLLLLAVAVTWWVVARRSHTSSAGGGVASALLRQPLAAVGSVVLAACAAVTVVLTVVRTPWGELVFEPMLYDSNLPLGLIRDELTSPRLAVLLLYLVPGVLWLWRRGRRASPPRAFDRWGVALLVVHLAVLAACFVVSSYGGQRSPRFLLPAYSSIPVLAAVAAVHLNRWWRGAGTAWFVSLLAVNLAVQLAVSPGLALQPAHHAGRLPVPRTYAPLARQVEQVGCAHVYASYWVGFPLVFESRERVKVSTGGDGRLPELDRAVSSSDRVAFVFYRGRMDEISFRQLLDRGRFGYQVTDVGPFRIFHELAVQRLRASPEWRRVVRLLSLP